MVDLVKGRFEAVWESVAPVSIAVFDLGDGRTVKGTVGGEIALYFCRPDGKVFDILPALHSPAATRQAIEKALELYDRTGATDAATAAYHRERLAAVDLDALARSAAGSKAARARLRYRMDASDAGTRALAEMGGSKTMIMHGSEPIVVVEPGGIELYKREVHERLAASSTHTPEWWKAEIFEQVLGQELKGGEFKYDSSSLAPLSLIEGE